MINSSLRRGLVAGLLAGLLAGVFGLAVAGPPLDDAIALEMAAAGAAHDGQAQDGQAHDGDALSRDTQRLGLVLGMVLFGAAAGAAFGIASAWSAGRLAGSAWVRAWKLAAVAIAALVVLPAIAYPPNPPAVGDPSTVGTRTAWYLATAGAGVLIATAAWWTQRTAIRHGVAPPTAQAGVLLGVMIVVGVGLAAVPSLAGPDEFPAELLWRFRLTAIGTQTVLWLGVGGIYGLLASDRRGARDRPAVAH